MKVAVCAGGTGGHIYPACALLDALHTKGHEGKLIVDSRGLPFCKDIADVEAFPSIRFGWNRLLQNFGSAIVIILRMLLLCVRWRPDVIVGFGGLFTIIPILVAKLCGTKVVLYEQNAVIGRANRLLSAIANLRVTSYEQANGWKKISALVRKEFLKKVPYKCDDKITILVMGGSQGARSFSSIIPEVLSRLSDTTRRNLELIQQESYGNVEKLQQIYKSIGVKATVEPYIDDVAKVMSSSQLVICRAGASTLSELSALGRPAILIPFPSSAENHQLCNATYYSRKGSAWVLEEKKFIVTRMASLLDEIFSNRELLKTAASNIIDSSASTAADSFIDCIKMVSGQE